MESRYLKVNSYHNWKHAVDVCHTVFRFVVETQSHTFLTPLETMGLLISAVSHDVGHPGLSNSFLIEAKHSLAILHNDHSPLENMHCSTLYEIVGKPEFDVFSGLDKEDWRTCRKIIISAILGTDMMHHFQQVSKIQVFYEMHGQMLQKSIINGTISADDTPGIKEQSNRMFLIDVFLHAADISNPVKSFDICKKWAYMIVEEFFNQGDMERERGSSISPMMDRDTTNIFTMQVGFIEFVVFPLYEAFVRTFPTLEVLLRNMVANSRAWSQSRLEELKHDSRTHYSDRESNEAEIAKLENRLQHTEQKVEQIINGVLPIAKKLEESKQQYEDLVKVVTRASTILKMDSSSPMRRLTRRLEEEEEEEEDEDDAEEGGNEDAIIDIGNKSMKGNDENV